jgi:predicted ATPase
MQSKAQFSEFPRSFRLLAAAPPALPATRASQPHRTPAPIHALAGSEDDLSWLSARIREGAPLLTLFGPPGVGKTRLALEAVRAARDAGSLVAFCDMSAARTENDVVDALLAALPQGDVANADPASALSASLRACAPAVVVLDGFQHLVERAAPLVATWSGIEGVTFVITSRQLLLVRGEMARELAPLPLPREPAAIEASPSGAMLLAAIGRYRQEMALGEEERQALFELLLSTEGLPQIIEKLAPQVALLGCTTARDRYLGEPEIMPETIGTSWALLSDDEQRALCCASLFRAPFSLDAVAAVLDTDEPAALRLLVALRSKSMVRALPGASCFALFAAIAEFAGRRLEPLGLRDPSERRFLAHFAAKARAVHDDERNEHLALEFAVARAARDEAYAILRRPPQPSSRRHWLSLLEHALHALPLGGDAASGHVLYQRAACHLALEEHGAAAGDFARALEIAQAHGERELRALSLLGVAESDTRGEPSSLQALESALALFRELGNVAAEARAVMVSARRRRNHGDLEAARSLSRLALDLSPDDVTLTHAAIEMAHVLVALRLPESAEAALAPAKTGAMAGDADVVAALALVRHVTGALDEAAALYRESATQRSAVGRAASAARCRALLAMVLIEQDRLGEAFAELTAATVTLRQQPHPIDSALADTLTRVVRAKLHGAPLPPAGPGGELDAMIGLVNALVDPTGLHARAVGAPAPLESALLSSAVERMACAARVRAMEGVDLAARLEPSPHLLVHAEGHWFRVPNETVLVHCRTRQAIRAILARLAEERRDRPGFPIDNATLIGIGWPDERMAFQAARSRLKQSMLILRKMGMGALLVWRNGGYLLDPNVPLEIHS